MKMHNVSIEVEQDIILANDKLAYKNRQKFDENNVFTVDLVGAVGSGKTSLLEKLIDEMDDSIAVIAGDILSKFDAKRIENKRNRQAKSCIFQRETDKTERK